MITLFRRFIVCFLWSNSDLWYFSEPDGSKFYQLFSIIVCDRVIKGKTFKGMQIVLGKLAVAIGDLNSTELVNHNLDTN